MARTADKVLARHKRHRRVRKKLAGTPERPRLAVFKSLKHIYAQLIDDEAGHTVASASTQDRAVADGLKSTGDTGAAVAVGKAVAERAKEKGITRAVFDRAGYPYHGRLKALAEAARKAGLEF